MRLTAEPTWWIIDSRFYWSPGSMGIGLGWSTQGSGFDFLGQRYITTFRCLCYRLTAAAQQCAGTPAGAHRRTHPGPSGSDLCLSDRGGLELPPLAVRFGCAR